MISARRLQDAGLAGPLMVAPGTVAPACEFWTWHTWHCDSQWMRLVISYESLNPCVLMMFFEYF